MTRLTDTQSLLLATAAQRESGSLLPLPASITAAAVGIARSLASLVKKGYAEELKTRNVHETHRTEEDVRFGLYVTATGLAAIGVDDGTTDNDGTAPPSPSLISASARQPTAGAAPRITKAGAVLALLQREDGATLAELIETTGWLPHTMRAALTGLRKKGHGIKRYKRDNVTCYRMNVAEAA